MSPAPAEVLEMRGTSPSDAAATAGHRGPWERVRQALADAGRAFQTMIALARGYWCRLSTRLRGVHFHAGRRLRIYGRLRCHGPGQVILGDDVAVYGETTPWTYSPEATIMVGDRVLLGGVRFGCIREITIGDDSILEDVSIADTDFHSTRADRRASDVHARVAPVRVGRNVWIAEHTALLPGASIGENSVVAYGAICMRPFPSEVIVQGNPARIVAPVPPSMDSSGATQLNSAHE